MAGRKSKAQSVLLAAPVVKQHGLEVSVSSFEEMDAGNYVNFVMEVTIYYFSIRLIIILFQVQKDGITWELRKRYSEFRFFYQALAEHTGGLSVEFPPKQVCEITADPIPELTALLLQVGKMSTDQLERRRIAIDLWMSDFLDNVAMSPSVTNQVYAFMRVFEHTSGEL